VPRFGQTSRLERVANKKDSIGDLIGLGWDDRRLDAEAFSRC